MFLFYVPSTPMHSLRLVQAAEASICITLFVAFQKGLAYRPLEPRADKPYAGIVVQNFEHFCLLFND